MKHRIFAFAAIALFTGHARMTQAVALSPRGEGQALVFPYYTVNKGLDTLIAFDNDADIGKLVNVRFVEGYNGRTVLDFNVWLGPHDGWLGSLSSDGHADSAAHLFSSDRSCSSLALSPAVPFSTAAFDGSSETSPSDGGPTDASRTREGHFEVIAIGDIPAGSDTESAVRQFRCADIPADAELDKPTPTLFGTGTIIDVSNGYFYGYNADALTGFSDKVLARDGSGPTLADANSSGSATPGGALATVFDGAGNALTIDYARGIDAVTAVYMAGSITNEYNVLPGLGASTDWVIAFPTKRFYVDKQLYPSAITQPFQEAFATTGASVVTARYDNIPIDHDGSMNSPRCATTPDDTCYESAFLQRFRYEANVVPFARMSTSDPSKVFGSHLLPPYDIGIGLPVPGHPELGAGWVHLDFVEVFGADSAGTLLGGERNLSSGQRVAVELQGTPATGFMAYNIVNADVSQGKLANYGGLFAHRMGAPVCAGDDGACAAR